MQRKRLLERHRRLREASLLHRSVGPALQQGSPLGVVCRGELKRPGEAGLGAGHVDGQCALPGQGEEATRPRLQLGDVLLLTGGAGQLQRLYVVMSEHVAEVVDPVPSLALDPTCRSTMTRGPA